MELLNSQFRAITTMIQLGVAAQPTKASTLADILAVTSMHRHEISKYLRQLMSDGRVMSTGEPADPYYCLIDNQGETRVQ